MNHRCRACHTKFYIQGYNPHCQECVDSLQKSSSLSRSQAHWQSQSYPYEDIQTIINRLKRQNSYISLAPAFQTSPLYILLQTQHNRRNIIKVLFGNPFKSQSSSKNSSDKLFDIGSFETQDQRMEIVKLMMGASKLLSLSPCPVTHVRSSLEKTFYGTHLQMYTICAYGAFYYDDPAFHALTTKYYQKAVSFLPESLENPSITSIHGVISLAKLLSCNNIFRYNYCV